MTEKPIVSWEDLPAFNNRPEGNERFGADIRSISMALDLGGLGAMHVTVMPGRRAFPFHNHLGNDEMFVILEGEGVYRFGSEEHPIKAGDVCSAPRGGPDKAHQIVNTSDKPVKYLGISTSCDPDVIEYPDSGRFAAMAVAPGRSFMDAHLRYIGRKENSMDYWDGEE